MRQNDLIADRHSARVLETDCDLEFAVAIQRVDHEYVVVQIDAAPSHQDLESPVVSSMGHRVAYRVGQLAVNASLHGQLVELENEIATRYATTETGDGSWLDHGTLMRSRMARDLVNSRQ
jgi:hypothetical protein